MCGVVLWIALLVFDMGHESCDVSLCVWLEGLPLLMISWSDNVYEYMHSSLQRIHLTLINRTASLIIFGVLPTFVTCNVHTIVYTAMRTPTCQYHKCACVITGS